MFGRCPFSLFVVMLVPAAAVAQPPNVEDVRVITSTRLSILSYVARQPESSAVFSTQELKSRLAMVPPTDAILLTRAASGQNAIVWYTDPATTRPNPIVVTVPEHECLAAYAEGGLSKLFGMRSGPVSYTEMVETTDPSGNKITVPVMKTMTVVPSEAELKAALDAIGKVTNPHVRASLELAAGYKFAELYPSTGNQPAPAQASALADKYRLSVFNNAVRQFAAKPASELPPLNEPVVFGNTNVDPLSLARAVEGAEPVASFETEGGKFSAIWDKSTLVLLRQPKNVTLGPGHRLKLNDDWMKAFDPRNKEPLIRPFGTRDFPGAELPARVTPGGTGSP